MGTGQREAGVSVAPVAGNEKVSNNKATRGGTWAQLPGIVIAHPSCVPGTSCEPLVTLRVHSVLIAILQMKKLRPQRDQVTFLRPHGGLVVETRLNPGLSDPKSTTRVTKSSSWRRAAGAVPPPGAVRLSSQGVLELPRLLGE